MDYRRQFCQLSTYKKKLEEEKDSFAIFQLIKRRQFCQLSGSRYSLDLLDFIFLEFTRLSLWWRTADLLIDIQHYIFQNSVKGDSSFPFTI